MAFNPDDYLNSLDEGDTLTDSKQRLNYDAPLAGGPVYSPRPVLEMARRRTNLGGLPAAIPRGRVLALPLPEKVAPAPVSDFDPDAYLAKLEAPAMSPKPIAGTSDFDPDAYLAKIETPAATGKESLTVAPAQGSDIPISYPSQPKPWAAWTPAEVVDLSQKQAKAWTTSRAADKALADLDATYSERLAPFEAELRERGFIQGETARAHHVVAESKRKEKLRLEAEKAAAEQSLAELNAQEQAAKVPATAPSFEQWFDEQKASGRFHTEIPYVPDWVQAGLSKLTGSLAQQAGGLINTAAKSSETARNVARGLEDVGAYFNRDAQSVPGVSGKLGRAAGTVAGLTVANPAGLAGIGSMALRAESEAEAATRAAGGTNTEAQAAGTKALAMLPIYMAGGHFAGKAGAALARGASPLVQAATGTVASAAGNIAMSASLAAIEGHEYGLENLAVDSLFGLLHGKGVWNGASQQTRQRAFDELANRGIDPLAQAIDQIPRTTRPAAPEPAPDPAKAPAKAPAPEPQADDLLGAVEMDPIVQALHDDALRQAREESDPSTIRPPVDEALADAEAARQSQADTLQAQIQVLREARNRIVIDELPQATAGTLGHARAIERINALDRKIRDAQNSLNDAFEERLRRGEVDLSRVTPEPEPAPLRPDETPTIARTVERDLATSPVETPIAPEPTGGGTPQRADALDPQRIAGSGGDLPGGGESIRDGVDQRANDPAPPAARGPVLDPQAQADALALINAKGWKAERIKLPRQPEFIRVTDPAGNVVLERVGVGKTMAIWSAKSDIAKAHGLPVPEVPRIASFRRNLPGPPEGAHDFLEQILDTRSGKTRSPVYYRKRGLPVPDGYELIDQVPLPWRNILFSEHGAELDTLLSELAEPAQGETSAYLSEASPDLFFGELLKSIAARHKRRAEDKGWEKEGEKVERFERDRVKPKKGTEKLDNDELRVGDVLELGKEQFEVKGIDEDGYVTLEDGEKYGLQYLAPGEFIYAKVKKRGPEEAGDTDNIPFSTRRPKLQGKQDQGDLLSGAEDDAFNLAGERGTDPWRIQKEREAAEARAEALRLDAEKRQVTMDLGGAPKPPTPETPTLRPGQAQGDFDLSGQPSGAPALKPGQRQGAFEFSRRERRAEPEAFWRRVWEKVAPKAAQEISLSLRDPAALVDAGLITADNLTGRETAAWIARENAIWLLDKSIDSKLDPDTLLDVLHESGHAWAEGFSPEVWGALERLWKAETENGEGPLYDGAGQLRENVNRDVTRSVKEWHAERVAHENLAWAKTRAAAAEHNGTLLGKLAAGWRSAWLRVRHAMSGEKPDVLTAKLREFLTKGEHREAEYANGHVSGPALFSIRAHHGTPHNVDKFRTDKIGTGEGSQAYGWGLYFAENKAVAEQYRKTLSDRGIQSPTIDGGKPLYKASLQAGYRKAENEQNVIDAIKNFLQEGAARNALEFEGKSMIEVLAQFKSRLIEQSNAMPDYKEYYDGVLSVFDEVAQRIDADSIKAKGNTYTVSLDVEPEQLLDWDKPLSEQSDQVKAALPPKALANAAQMRASEWYKRITHHPDLAKDTSEYLASLGIPGIRFLDQGSRGRTRWTAKHPKGGENEFPTEQAAREFLARNPEYTLLPPEQTYNYVMFDDSRIKIVERNGQPAPDEVQFSTRRRQEDDPEYMKAVERGDLDTAQRIVDDAAKAAGYKQKRFHQTSEPAKAAIYKEGFRLDKGRARMSDDQVPDAFFFKADPSDIGVGAAKGAVQIPVYLRFSNPLAFETREQVDSWANKIPGYIEVVRGRRDFDAAQSKEFDRRWAEYATLERGSPEKIDFHQEQLEAFTDEWNKRSDEMAGQARQIITQELRRRGNDAVMLANDKGSFNRTVDTTVVFDPEQIKSADPITYDDAGNVIPLSQRFNPQSKDIRFSIRDKKERDQRILDAMRGKPPTRPPGTPPPTGQTPAPLPGEVPLDATLPRISRVWRGTADVFDVVPGLGFLSKAIRKHVDTQRMLQGKVTAPFREWEQRHGRTARKQGEKEFAEYQQRLDQERDPDLVRDITRGHIAQTGHALEGPSSDQIRQGASVAGRELMNLWDGAAARVQARNKALGVLVKNADGVWRPIGTVTNYYPRSLKPSILKALRNLKANRKFYAELSRELYDAGLIKSVSEAEAFINQHFRANTKFDHMGNIEAARAVKMPTRMYDYSFEAGRRYLISWTERVAQIEAFGQKTTKTSKDVFDHALEKTIGNEPVQEYIGAARDLAYGVRSNSTWAKALRLLNTAAVGLQLGNPVTVGVNLASGLAYNSTHFGWLNAMKGFWELRKLGKVMNDAHESGVLLEDLMGIAEDARADGGTAHEVAAKVTGKLLEVSGYNASERFVRSHGYATAKAFLRQYLKNPAEKQFRRFFDRAHINADKLATENGTGPETDRFLRRSIYDTQGGYRYDQVPVFTDTGVGRFLFKYQKWGTQALRNFVINSNPLGKRYAEPAAWASAARYVLTIALVGAGIEDAKERIFGVAPRTAGLEELAKTASEDQKRAFHLASQKLWRSLMAGGAFGLLGNYAQAATDVFERSRFKNPLDPPALSALKGAGELMLTAFEQGKLTTADFTSFVSKQVSLVRTLKAAAAKAAAATGAPAPRILADETTRQNLAWVGGITRRFLDEKKIEGSKTSIGRAASTPLLPYKRDLVAALYRGDIPGGSEAIKAYIDNLAPEQRDDAMKSLGGYVQTRQPIKVDGSTGAVRDAFIQWAQRRLPTKDFTRLMKLDATYRQTGQSLNVMSAAKPRTDKDLDAALRKRAMAR